MFPEEHRRLQTIMADPTTEDRLDQLVQLVDEDRYDEVLEILPELKPEAEETWFAGCLYGLELVCLRRLQRMDDFEERLESLVGDSETDSNLMLGAGILCSDLGSHELAENILEALCRQHPESHVPSFHLGLALARSDRHQEAIACYDESLQREYLHAPSYRHKALSLRKLDRVDEAATTLHQYLKLEADDAEAWTMLGAGRICWKRR